MAPISRHLLDNAAVHGVIVGSRLRESGGVVRAIRHAVRTERLFRQYPGAFSLSPSLTAKGRWFAAVAACGDGAALSNFSAARLWQLIEAFDHRIDVTVPTHHGRKPPEPIRIHRSITLPGHTTRRDRIEVTQLRRTIDDCAYRLDHQQLHRILRAAEYHHGLGIDRLAAVATSVLRFTWSEVVATPQVVVRDLQHFLATRRGVES
jgi:hypothetical protein